MYYMITTTAYSNLISVLYLTYIMIYLVSYKSVETFWSKDAEYSFDCQLLD